MRGGNAGQQSRGRAPSRETLSPALERVREAANRDRKLRFISLLHHVDVDLLRQSYYALKRKAAPGVDGTTWEDYGHDLESNLEDLHGRVHPGVQGAPTGPCRAAENTSRRRPSTRLGARQRALAIAALEDKIVQRAVATVLNQIYEVDFLGFSYGFRPGRGQHDALDALATGFLVRKVNWILDADISGFFDSLSQECLMDFLKLRVADRRLLRLIGKWLKAGILEEGLLTVPEQGTPQGSVISPLLSNVYLHHVLDRWAEEWRQRHARGDVIIVRYADDFVVGFQHRADAARFRADLEVRLEQHALALHPDKTRLIEFGRFAASRRARRGAWASRKPRTFRRLPGLHAHLREEPQGKVPATPQDAAQADEVQAQGDQV